LSVREIQRSLLAWCFLVEVWRHDRPVELKLIYQMFAELLSWMVLRTRCDAVTCGCPKCCAHRLTCRFTAFTAQHDRWWR
jgi:hypothetical protein